MKKGRFFRVSVKKEDKGVAEVVGAILLFAILITLFTSFMVWYIPAQSTANETHYEIQNKAALGNLVSNLHSSSISPGSTVTASIPLGISGVSIFSQAQDTQFSILPQSNSFNSTLSFDLLLNLTGNSGTTSHYVNLSYRLGGLMETSASTEYITAINYLIEDGALLQQYSSNQPSDNLGPLPLGVSGTSGGYSLSLSAIAISGPFETFSSTGSQVVNLLVNNSTSHDYLSGSSAIFSGTTYTITSMSLQSLNYTFNGTMANAWDYSFYTQYNSSMTPYSSVIPLSGWNFSRAPLSAHASNSTFAVLYKGNLPLNSFSTQYSVYQGD